MSNAAPSKWFGGPAGNTASVTAATHLTLAYENDTPLPPVFGEAALKRIAATLTNRASQQDHFPDKDSAMGDPTREEISAQIKSSEAATETKIVRLEGKIDTLQATILGRIDTLQSSVSSTKGWITGGFFAIAALVVSTAIGLAALIIGVATYGDALFGRGMNVRDVVQAVIKEQQSAQQNTVQTPQAPHR
jgi:hypothetical protein